MISRSGRRARIPKNHRASRLMIKARDVGPSPARAVPPDLIGQANALFILGLIIAIGVVTRLSAARNLPLHVDEAATILASEQIATHGYPLLPSGTVYLQGASYSYLISPLPILDVSPVEHLFLFRLLSVIAGSIGLVIMYRVGVAFIGRVDAALLATALLAIDPLSVRWSGLARMYGLLQALSLLVFLLFYGQLSGPRQSHWRVVAIVLVFLAAVFTHVGASVLLPPMFIAAWLRHRGALLGSRRDISQTLALCSFSPILLFTLHRLGAPPGERPDGEGSRSWFVGDYLLSTARIMRPDFDAWISTFRSLPLDQLFPALLIAGTGFLAARYTLPGPTVSQEFSRASSFLLIALFYWIPVVLIAATVDVGESRYFTHIHPLGYLIFALLVVELLEWPRHAYLASSRAMINRSTPHPIGVDSIPARASLDILAVRPEDIASGARWRSRWSVALSLGLPLLIGIAFRLPLIQRTSLWLDEGFTVLYSRLPWTSVLGSNGFFSPHPPLYFVVVKASSVVIPATHAGRVISALASIATIWLVWMICDRLLGRRAAFFGTLSLVLSPMHIYYAQEARMYALVVCMVALSYLALIVMNTEISWWWSASFAVAATTALYLDYSAAFALAPQLLLIGYLIDRHRRAAIPLLICVTLGALLYAPWVPHLVDSVQAANEVERREAYLGTDSTRVPDTLLALVGLGGDGSYVQSTRNLLWDEAPALQPIYLVTILGVCALGIRTLLSRQLAALVVASALGTVAVAIWVSQISPAFAERTVLSAVIGWALIVAACGSAGIATPRDRLASSLAIVAIGISSFGAWIVDTSATKQRWEDAVDDISRTEAFGFPVVTYSYGHVADTFIDLYGSGDLDRVNLISIRGGDLEDVLSNGLLPDRGMTLAEAQAGALGEALEFQGSMPQFIWFLYYVRPGTNELIDTIQNLGYERVRYGEYWSPRYRVYLDLFALSNVSSGDSIVVNGSFQNRGEGWSLPNNAAALSSEGESTNLILSGDGVTPQRATTSLPGGNSLYDLTIEVRTELDPKVVEISLGCADGNGKTSIVTKMNSRDEVWANTYRWETVRLAAVCPEETTTVQILLGVAGLGTVEFRNVELLAVRPGFVTSLDD